MAAKTEPVTFSCEKEIKEIIEEIARKEERTKSTVFNRILKLGLKKYGKDKQEVL